MKFSSGSKAHRRRGLSVAELIVAAGIALTLLVGVAQLMHQATRQYRRTAERNLVAWEAANAMEDLMSRSWEELTSGRPPELEVSAACRQALGDVQLRVEVVRVDNEEGVRRVTVSVDWQEYGARRAEPYRLVAWRYRQQQNEGLSP